MIRELTIGGLVGFDIPFGNGVIRDSISGTAATAIDTPSWGRRGKQRGIYFSDGACLTLPDTAANRLAGSGMSLVVYAPNGLIAPLSGETPTMLSKSTAVTQSWRFYQSAGNIVLYDGANSRTLAISSHYGKRCWVVTLQNGSTGKIYADGSFIGNLSGANTISSLAASVYIGNHRTYLMPMRRVISRVIGVNAALTPLQVSELFEELAVTHCGGPKCFGFPANVVARKTCTFRLALGNCHEVTIAPVTTAGAPISNTPWRHISETTSLVDDAKSLKWLETSTAGGLACQARVEANGLGTHVVRLRQGSSVGAIAAYDWAVSDPPLASGTGYRLSLSGGVLSLSRVPAGTVLFSSSPIFAADKDYIVAVSKSVGNVMTIHAYIGGVWTQVPAAVGGNPVTDATYTTGNYIRAYCVERTCRVGAVYHHQGVLTGNDLREMYS